MNVITGCTSITVDSCYVRPIIQVVSERVSMSMSTHQSLDLQEIVDWLVTHSSVDENGEYMLYNIFA